jgi:hypothetical protein
VNDWKKLEAQFFEKVQTSNRFEIWSKFAFEKIADGCARITRNNDMKRDLEKK